MPVDLNSLKSAVVIDDLGKINELLDRRSKLAAEGKFARPNHTTFRRDKEGKILIAKQSAFVQGEVKAAPATPDVETLKALAKLRGLPWDDKYSERVMPYWASDERVDGQGDIVRQNWTFAEFEKNPVLPYSHQWGNPPIGNALDWKIVQRSDEQYSGPALWLLALFALAEQYEWADTIFRLIKGRFLRGGSVGFYSMKIIDVKDEDERRKLGLGRYGYILDDNHLLEFSPTTIGANSGAYTILESAKSQNLLQPKDFCFIRELHRREIAETTRSKEEWTERDGINRAIARALFPEFEFTEHPELDKPFEPRNWEAKTAAAPRIEVKCPGSNRLAAEISALSQKLDALKTDLDAANGALNDVRDIIEEIRAEDEAKNLHEKTRKNAELVEETKEEIERQAKLDRLNKKLEKLSGNRS